MKSLAELENIRKKTLEKMKSNDVRVVVGMATCGIAAGARPVLDTLVSEVKNLKLDNVTVTQTGCVGVCRLEPIVEVYVSGEKKATYVKMTADKAKKVAEDLAKGNVVTEYTIGAAD